MVKRRHFRFAVLAPLALIAVSLWLLVGCLYIPTPHFVICTGSKRDFQQLVGETGSRKPIVAGRISRAGVESLLGRPPYESPNHLRALYVIHVRKDIVLMPLCLTAINDTDDSIGLLLEFDDVGLLQRWTKLASGAREFNLLDGPYGLTAGFDMERGGDQGLLIQAHRDPPEWQLQSTKK